MELNLDNYDSNNNDMKYGYEGLSGVIISDKKYEKNICGCNSLKPLSTISPFKQLYNAQNNNNNNNNINKINKVNVIVNPFGGNGSGKRAWLEIEPILNERNSIKYELHKTKYAGHATEICLNLDLNEEHDAIVSIGGDGTIMEIVTGILNRGDKKKVPILFIAAGTGNSICRTLNHINIKKTINLLYDGCIKYVDIGKILFESDNNRSMYMLNTLNIGITSAANERAEKLRCFGKERYRVATTVEVIRRTHCTAKISMDDQLLMNGKYTMITIQSNQHFGNNFAIAPYAQMDDGLFDLIIFRKYGLIETFNQMLSIPKCTHLYRDTVDYFRFQRMQIETQNEEKVYVDGDYGGVTPIKLEILKRFCPIIVASD